MLISMYYEFLSFSFRWNSFRADVLEQNMFSFSLWLKMISVLLQDSENIKINTEFSVFEVLANTLF